MPVTTTKSRLPNTVPTTVLLGGSTVYGDRQHNITSRTTPMTKTVAANDTGFNSTKPSEPVAGGYGAAMVLVPFGIIVIGLAVVMILYIRKRNRLEKLRLQLMPMYSFDPAEEQDELESEMLEQNREAATTGAELKGRFTRDSVNSGTDEHLAHWAFSRVSQSESSEMERKCKGGTEKLQEKQKLALQADGAKCAKITDMFATAGPSSAPVADDSGGGGSADCGTHAEEDNVKTATLTTTLGNTGNPGCLGLTDVTSTMNP